MGEPAMSPGSYAPVSARFPIPLRRESPSGVWVPLPSQGTRLKPLMQAMPFARLAQERLTFLTTTLTMALFCHQNWSDPQASPKLSLNDARRETQPTERLTRPG